MIATAPGKVLLAGEYAVLHGHPAVVLAVDRRVVARIQEAQAVLSPFLQAVRDQVAWRFGDGSVEARAAARVVVDASSLERDGRKLGLGSSAAATVAAVAVAISKDSVETSPARRATQATIHAIAHAAHGAAQAPRGSRGSGADVAAATHGGVLLVARDPGAPDGAPLAVTQLPWLRDAQMVLVWTGRPADTPSLVAKVRAFQDGSPQRHAELIAEIGAQARALAAALFAGSDEAVITAISEGAGAIRSLGSASSAPLVPPSLTAISELARELGGAAKPTGAGGGDLIVAILPDPERAESFRGSVLARGLEVVPASVDPRGVELAPAVEKA
ncbi:MAG: hypothetical protein HY698_16485 [Deltaproteobacteria bacterium]|nr:hypothetical protein [Deltaproteobacteria bacterium]